MDVNVTHPTETETEWHLVTLARAARRAGLGRRQLLRACAAGELPVFDLGGWPRVRWVDVVVWITRHERRST